MDYNRSMVTMGTSCTVLEYKLYLLLLEVDNKLLEGAK